MFHVNNHKQGNIVDPWGYVGPKRRKLPEGSWDYFCLDAVPYHGHMLTIIYDKTGKKYGKGIGLRILADGKEIGSSKTLGRLTAPLPKK